MAGLLGRRVPVRFRVVPLMLVFAVLAVGCGGERVVLTPSSAGEVVTGGSGSVVEVGSGSDVAPGARLVVPSGVDEDVVGIGLSARPGSSGPWEVSESTVAALTVFALEEAETTGLHPIWTPLQIVTEGALVGPEFVMEPDGAEFSEPVVLEIPAPLVGLAEGETVLALLESADGRVTVIGDVAISGDRVVVPLTHFSTVKLVRIAQNIMDAPWTAANPGFHADMLDAMRLVGPKAFSEGSGVVAAHCGRADEVVFDASRMPSYVDLLGNLSDVDPYASLAGVSIYEEGELEDWLEKEILEQGAPAVTVADVYNKALDIANNDAFQALVIAHEVLRADRIKGKYDQLITDVRGDGEDELGARYHLFGTAIYAFWYQHRMANPQGLLDSIVVPPEITVALEEMLVSGDIDTDPGEFIVDLAGIQMGRDLYGAATGTSVTFEDGRLVIVQDPCPEQEPDTAATPNEGEEGEAAITRVYEGEGLLIQTFYRSGDDASFVCERSGPMDLTLDSNGTATFRYHAGIGMDIKMDSVECKDATGNAWTGTHDPANGRFTILPPSDELEAWELGGPYNEESATVSGTYSFTTSVGDNYVRTTVEIPTVTLPKRP